MRLSRSGYFADFVVYPPVATMLIVAAMRPGSLVSWREAVVACAAGVVVWTLLEYIIHRVVLHEVRYFAMMHEMHHDDPGGFVGTPTWLSLSMICSGALLPLWWETGFDLASSFTAGLMGGYLWYVTVHHVIHHWRIEPGTYLYRLKHHHGLHHHAPVACNFGVTNSFWDRLFGTTFAARRPAVGSLASPVHDSDAVAPLTGSAPVSPVSDADSPSARADAVGVWRERRVGEAG
jgi:sterol desaturase/sphingolipid hydroxylase (fatty acid hydroxylase superfamily)